MIHTLTVLSIFILSCISMENILQVDPKTNPLQFLSIKLGEKIGEDYKSGRLLKEINSEADVNPYLLSTLKSVINLFPGLLGFNNSSLGEYLASGVGQGVLFAGVGKLIYSYKVYYEEKNKYVEKLKEAHLCKQLIANFIEKIEDSNKGFKRKVEELEREIDKNRK